MTTRENTKHRFRETSGNVISITYPGFGETPVVRVNIQTPTGVLALVFQSRTSLEALEIGQCVRVRGNVVMSEGVPSIYNPYYSIESAGYAAL